MNKIRKWNHVFFSILLVAIISIAAIPAVSAFTATLVSPADPTTAIFSGNVISIRIDGLAAGDQFKYKITSADLQTPGNTFTLSNVNMPFDFSNGSSLTLLKTTGITAAGTTLTVKRLSDATELQLTGATITSAKNIKKGNYDVSITGTKMGTDLGIDYGVSGTVSNPGTSSSTLSFTLSNVDTGHLTIEVLDGTASRLHQTFTINKAFSPKPGVSATTETLQHNTAGMVLAESVVTTDPTAEISSSLKISSGTTIVSGTGQPVDAISITPLDSASVPDVTAAQTAAQGGVFSFSGLSIDCEPTGTQFNGGGATLSFSLTPAQWTDALSKVNSNTAGMTIQYHDTVSNTWVAIPTTVDTVTHTVSAQVTHFSTYALLYNTAGSSVSSGISQSSSGGDTSPAPAGQLAPKSASSGLLAPPAINATSVTLLQNEEGKVLAQYSLETDPTSGFSSALEIDTGTAVVSSTGYPVHEISVSPINPSTVPEFAAAQGNGFIFSGLSVYCLPADTRFVGGNAAISFSLTPAQWADALSKVNGNTTAMSIQYYDTLSKTWIEVPTTIDTVAHTARAQITHFSMYALFYKTTQETLSQTSGDMAQLTATPVTTPFNTMLAPPITTKSPGLPGIVVISVIGFVGLYVMRKK